MYACTLNIGDPSGVTYFRGVPRCVTKCDRGRGSKLVQNGVTFFMGGPLMGRNTRQTNQIEELQTCCDEHAIQFRSTAFSRSVQATLVRPVFDAVVSKYILMVT